MTLVLRYAARSDRGLVRSNNQDSVYAGPRLLALADGMGGHAAGEVASKVVIAALAPLDDDDPDDDLLAQLRDATIAGNGSISELVASDPDLDGMGTTLTAVLFAGTRLGLVHIGDSRAYQRRNGQVTQITHDDTFVQSLIDEGRITEDEAANHPQRSLLLRALTGQDEVEPNLTVREARAGDRYLLCSDGLSGVVSHETLTEALNITDPQACADRMIELALKGGGPDNVTVIIADVVDVDFGEDAPIVGGAAGNGQDDPAPQADTAASRAAALTSPPPQPMPTTPLQLPEEEHPKAKRRKRVRWLAAILVLLILAAAGVLATRYFVMSQYYVGEDERGEIAIFQGVRGSVLGLELNEQVQASCADGDANCEPVYVDDLDQSARQTVRAGQPQDNLEDAENFLARMREHQLPICAEQEEPNQPNEQNRPNDPNQPNRPGDGGNGGNGGNDNGSTAQPPEQEQRPGVDCRPPRDAGGR
ncbi:protein phosphatase [Tamaricihabitans halophyticus]|uniref:Serine/threonine protein phosphatase PstP n=1 Tax=Tamaricihabitans halophyticus TaxID=1262583 RepID=A0A4R2QVI1_9PSEU|nr:protein phosphatase 2C domain-containing protein [Tamaricihabitans halophyticus]TCP54063.1 protein phosphatase [Tamaricihabitans halophyticus]